MDTVENVIQVQRSTETPNREEGEVEISVTETPNRVEGDNNSGDKDQAILLTPAAIFGQSNDPKPEDDEPVAKKPLLDLKADLDLPEVPREEDEGKWRLPTKLAEFFKDNTKQYITDKDILS